MYVLAYFGGFEPEDATPRSESEVLWPVPSIELQCEVATLVRESQKTQSKSQKGETIEVRWAAFLVA
jgi:hypothetical protein